MVANTTHHVERSRHPCLIDVLKAELAKLLMLITWETLVGCLRASKRSHDFQRFASRRGAIDVGITIFKPRRILN